jgi:hypothetical protein
LLKLLELLGFLEQLRVVCFQLGSFVFSRLETALELG